MVKNVKYKFPTEAKLGDGVLCCQNVNNSFVLDIFSFTSATFLCLIGGFAVYNGS